MHRTHLVAAAFVAAAFCAAPAWAATSTSIVVTSQGETLPRSSIQLFNAESGAEVRMEEADDDRAAALFLLDGGRYRVAVNGETVREISVSGAGSQSFTIEVPPRVAAQPPQGITPEDEEAVANYMRTLFEVGMREQAAPAQSAFLTAIGIGELLADTEAGTGFQRPAGEPETFAGRNADSIRMHTIGLHLFPLAYRHWMLSGSLLYGEGDEDSRGQVAAGGTTDAGYVHGALSPEGSSGLNLGPNGSVWTTESEAEFINLKFKMTRIASGPVGWFLFADYLHSQRGYDGAVSIDAFGETFSQTRDQRVTDELIGGGAGISYFWPVNQRFGIGGWTSAGLFHRSSELRSVERNVCPLCAPADQDFTLRFDEEDSDITWTLATGLFVEIPISDRVSFGAGVDATYIDEVGTVFNPHSGDQVFFDGLTTELRTTDAVMINGRLGVRVAF